MPPIIRRQSRIQKLKANLNPYDFWLWLSEELESSGWDQVEKEWSISIGVAFNLLFLACRLSVGASHDNDDLVFGDDGGYGSWGSGLVRPHCSGLV